MRGDVGDISSGIGVLFWLFDGALTLSVSIRGCSVRPEEDGSSAVQESLCALLSGNGYATVNFSYKL